MDASLLANLLDMRSSSQTVQLSCDGLITNYALLGIYERRQFDVKLGLPASEAEGKFVSPFKVQCDVKLNSG